MKEQPNARRMVLELLLSTGDFPTRKFGVFADNEGLTAQDRGFARQLLSGTLRNFRKLDVILEPYCKRRLKSKALRWTLRLGVYQLFFLEHIPDHAAVHSTLDSARPFLKGLSGFANGVLRNLQRSARLEEALPADPYQKDFSRKRLIVGRRSWMFDRPLFSNPLQHPAEFLAEDMSFPSLLSRRWVFDLGSDGARQRMTWMNQVPPLWIRVNSLRSSAEAVRASLEEANVLVHPGAHPQSFRLEKHGGDITKLPGFVEGHWAVQDLTSLETAALANPQPKERILDLCAAPGGKSFATYEFANGEAEVWACDIDEKRLGRLAPEADRLGHRISTQVLSANGGGEPDGPWDCILLDVPCTNTGVLHKRLEARGRFSKEELHRATTVQNLIRKAYFPRLLGKNTRVVWSTCSLEPEENQEMVARFVKQYALRLEKEVFFEPDGFRAGGYAALLLPA
ncbi:MAG: hypothetical protein OTJ44_02975 [Planctomycetota bacterium]|nr:hypothetical protein [Planctomycetota bacterium]